MLLSLVATMVKRLGALCLVSLIVWHAFRHSDAQLGKAIVHLPRADVMVSVDRHFYPVEAIEDGQLECTLKPGMHMVQVWHGLLLLREEKVQIEAGRQVDVRPFERYKTPIMPKANDPRTTSRPGDPSGLVVHDRRPASSHHL